MVKKRGSRKKSKAGDDKPSNGESFEKTLFKAADKLRKNIDAAEYKHVVLGLIFLKYISVWFESHHNKLIEGKGDYKGADPEDADEYKAENVFFGPPYALMPDGLICTKEPNYPLSEKMNILCEETNNVEDLWT